MIDKEYGRWYGLSQLIIEEKDPAKLLALLTELKEHLAAIVLSGNSDSTRKPN